MCKMFSQRNVLWYRLYELLCFFYGSAQNKFSDAVILKYVDIRSREDLHEFDQRNVF